LIFEIEREIKNALIVEEKDLLEIFKFITKRYKEVEINAECNDKTKIKFKNINEVTRFKNYNIQKIIKISIEGKNSFEERLYVTITNKDNTDSTAYFLITSKKEETFNYILGELNKWFLGAKPWYNFLAKISVFWCLFSLLSIICGILTISFLYLKFTGNILQEASKLNFTAPEQILITIIIIFLLYVICIPIDKLRRWLFPKLFFLLGKQKRTMEEIKNVRKILFSVILIGFIISVLSGLLLKII